MILSGCKQIAQYLNCGVRSAQRWQTQGLPIRRIGSGARSSVSAYSEQLDLWLKDGHLRQMKAADVLDEHQRSRDLVAKVLRSWHTLHFNMAKHRKAIETLKKGGR